MNFNDIFIKEEDFTTRMEAEVLPFMQDNLKGGYFENQEGGLLHYNYIICCWNLLSCLLILSL